VADSYVEALHKDLGRFAASQAAFARVKSSQQRLLERLLGQDDYQFERAADICCGGGALSYWLGAEYPRVHFTLIDQSQPILSQAHALCEPVDHTAVLGDVYRLPIKDAAFDLVCCWQALSWLERPPDALLEMLRVTRAGGRIYLSALFNTEHDVDCYCRVFDWTRSATQEGHPLWYITFSLRTLTLWLDGRVQSIQHVPHQIDVDLRYDGRGLGTYTSRLADGSRLQQSAGMTLNWGVVRLVR
jgi:SAM-dependent methyltransferase